MQQCRDHQSSCSPVTRRVYTSTQQAFLRLMARTRQTHFPPRPRKTAWRSDYSVMSHSAPQTRYNHVTPSWTKPRSPRQSSRFLATRRAYTSAAPCPQQNGLTQTHFPPRQRETKWHSDITHVRSPHSVPQTRYNPAIIVGAAFSFVSTFPRYFTRL